MSYYRNKNISKILNIKNILKKFIIFICLIISIYFFYLILNLTNSGLDLTDEGYYLNWISNPYIYRSSIFQFGFLYHPIFFFLNENLNYLRKLNIFSNFILSYFLIFLLVRVSIKSIKINFYCLQVFIIGFSLSIFLSMHIFTPSYNSLALQGLLITSLGILFLEKNKTLIGTFLIGIGSCITFMGKPSSAAALALTMLFYFTTRKNIFKLILLSSTFCLILIISASLAIDGSPVIFIKRIFLDLHHYQLLESGHAFKEIAKDLVTIVAKPEVQNNYAIFVTLISLLLFFIFLYIVFFFNLKKTISTHIFKLILISIIIIFFILIQFHYVKWILIFERYQKLQIFSVLIFSIFVILKFYKFNLVETFKNLNIRLISVFLVFPYVYAFGSNINLLKKSLEAGIFYLIASFFILVPFYLRNKNSNNLFYFLFTILIITSIHINSIIEGPYRQFNSLKSNNFILKINNKDNDIKLSDDIVKYINYAKNISRIAGLSKGDYILDLTGESPGLIYLLNANSLGSPWMVGGAPGSLEYAKAKLGLESCNVISGSWILYDQHDRYIPIELLNSYGADLLLDYQEVAKWEVPKPTESYEQKLFKPNNSNKIYDKCIKKRN
jgi:hypothetical protein